MAERKQEQISVPIDPALRQEIERVAQQQERSTAQQVRYWIAAGLAASRAAERSAAA